MMKLAVLGSTGSIGTQTLDVAARNRDSVEIVALAARSNCETIAAQALATGTHKVVIADVSRKDDAHLVELAEHGVEIGFGPEALEELCALPEVDCVLNALVGEAGLRASMRTLKERKRLALANKESLVVGGDLIMSEATHDTLLPVDSEHGAIYQCLIGERSEEVARLWVTASGGPFRGYSREMLSRVTRSEALTHPTWVMGPKITIDSATLMNKGLEVIEAHHLFSMSYDDISVVVQPQSCVHSMVEFTDGSVKAHMGVTDMRIPIQYALSYPGRWPAPTTPLDFTTLGSLEFETPDMDTFRCLRLAREAGALGGTAPAVLNAANEVAVAAFLADACRFTDIDYIVETALDAHSVSAVISLEQLEEIDGWARAFAQQVLRRL